MRKNAWLLHALACGTVLVTLTWLVAVPSIYAQTGVSVAGIVKEMVPKETLEDDKGRIIAGASVVFESTKNPRDRFEAISDTNGEFRFSNLAMGEYLVRSSAMGYNETKEAIQLTGILNPVVIWLILVETETVEVQARLGKLVEVSELAQGESFSEKQIDLLPASNSRDLFSIIGTLAGAQQDQRKDLHLYGGRPDQNEVLLDDVDVTNPATDKFSLEIPKETVERLNLFGGRFSARYRRGSGGILEIYPKTWSNTTCPPPKDDNGNQSSKWIDWVCKSFTDFVPGADFSKGLRIPSWKPRVTLLGPIIKDKMFFSNATSIVYRESIFHELPKGADSISSWNFSNFARIQAHAGNHRLIGGFIVNSFTAPHTGLTPLDPIETTHNDRVREWVGYARAYLILSPTWTLDVGYGAHRSFVSETPQGRDILRIFPDGRKGNSFTNARIKGQRDQWFVRVHRDGWNGHQFEAGMETAYARSDWRMDRTGYTHHRVSDGTPVTSVRFGGNPSFSTRMLDTGIYLQDRFTPPRIRWLLIEAGLRLDRIGVLGKSAVTPRVSLALAPPWFKGKTKFSGGIGQAAESLSQRLATRHLDQYSIFRQFDRQGNETGNPMVNVTVFEPDRLFVARSTNFSVGVEQMLPSDIRIRFDYLRRRTTNGYALFPTLRDDLPLPHNNFPPGSVLVAYEMRNSRREYVTWYEVGFSKAIGQGRFKGGQFQFSGVFSDSLSNAAVSIGQDDPVQYTDTVGKVPWDVPWRFLSSGLVPLGKRHEIAYFMEWRKGMPFTASDEEGRQVGTPNSRRIPNYFTLNMEHAVSFSLLGKSWTWTWGVHNITNRPNYTIPNTNVSSPAFPSFYGAQPRKLVVHLRLKK